MRVQYPTIARGAGVAIVVLFCTAGLGGCATPSGESVAEQRSAVLAMHDRTIRDLAAARPGFKARLEQAPGYGVFSNVSTKLLFLGAGSGYGVVVDNRSGQRTFMRMNELGAGVGVGVKDWRAVMVFNNPKAMYMFVQDAWDFNGGADATFKVGDKGDEISGGFIANDVDVYQFTEQGITLGAMMGGMRFYPDSRLNEPRPYPTRTADAPAARPAAAVPTSYDAGAPR